MMTILVDFSQIPLKKVGVGVYALNTFTNLFGQDRNNVYITLVQNDDPDLNNFHYSNVVLKKVSAKYFRSFFLRIFLEQIYIPYLIIKYKVNIVHSLHYSFPLLRFGARRVVTIHDLTFFIYPELHTFVKRFYFRWFIAFGSRVNNTMICVSQSTANDLMKFFPSINAIVRVIPLAMNKVPELLPFEQVKREFQLPESYILFIGTLEPRKNIAALIEAYGMISDKIVEKLVIVGKKGWFYESIFEKVSKLDLGDKIIFTGFVSESEKMAIIAGAKIFIYPSIYEGFGLPVLEAISQGRPTITSNISSMPEVAGDAALLVDPTNIEQIANSMLNLLENPLLQESLRVKAFIQASKFSWEITATKTLDIYNLL